MPTHVALLRGINVGSGDKNKIIMAELRRTVIALGHTDVATYIQTGNVIFTAATGPGIDRPEDTRDRDQALERALEAAIAADFGVKVPVIVRTASELAQIARDSPYQDEPNPKYVHAVFLPVVPAPGTADLIAAAVEATAQDGSRDEATLLERTLYVHTPDGFGTSGLAKNLLTKRASPVISGTARNWSTVTKLLSMCEPS
jgi:uncharacterized protein (DUF1697 family)